MPVRSFCFGIIEDKFSYFEPADKTEIGKGNLHLMLCVESMEAIFREECLYVLVPPPHQTAFEKHREEYMCSSTYVLCLIF